MKKIYQTLLAKAKQARKHAYAPYSHFQVGAAVLASSGKIYVGCNVENASLSMTLCAERNAISQAIARGETEIEVVAIVTDSNPLTPPCGACRQFIQEFGPKAVIILADLQGKTHLYHQQDLLPHPFTISYLLDKE